MPKTTGGVIPAGMVKLRHEEAAGCCYRGTQYLGDEDGSVLVLAEATGELSAHSFALILEAIKLPTGRARPSPGSRSAQG